MTRQEILADIDIQCTAIKQRVYALRQSIRLLHFEATVETALIEHLDKVHREFDSLQETCKARS